MKLSPRQKKRAMRMRAAHEASEKDESAEKRPGMRKKAGTRRGLRLRGTY